MNKTQAIEAYDKAVAKRMGSLVSVFNYLAKVGQKERDRYLCHYPNVLEAAKDL